MRILFIAGGLWQRAFVQYLKDKGHWLAVVNPVATSTTALADQHIVADINDLVTINGHISAIKPEYITSDQSDVATKIVATLNERWHLPGNTPRVIRRFSDKYAMYEHGCRVSVPVPPTSQVSSVCGVTSFATHYGYPVIVKPVDATMSRGFRKFNRHAEVTEDAIAKSLAFSRSKQLVVQTFVPGDMITLEGVCLHGLHHTLAASIKDGYFAPGINRGVRYPCTIQPAVLHKIITDNDLYCDSAGLRSGFTHAEYIVEGDKYTLIEIGARGGGAGIIDKIVPWVSGIPVYDVRHATMTGGTFEIGPLLHRPAYLKYYLQEEVAGCTEELAAQIRQLPGVADFQFDFKGKQYVTDVNDVRHTLGIYTAETDAGIEAIVQAVAARLQSQ